MSENVPEPSALRIASPDDIRRIGVVAASGFRYSPIFPWQRPYHTTYPADTLLSYRQIFTQAMRDLETVIVLAVDKYDPDEAKKSEVIIPLEEGLEQPAPGQEVVVGVAAWKLPPGSARVGQFKNEKGSYPELQPNLNRDQNPDHSKIKQEVTEEAEQKYLQDTMILDMLVVHPAYWRLGHGARLVEWAIKLARVDRVKLGVVATGNGQSLYARLGFKLLKELLMDERVICSVMSYDPEESESESEQRHE